MVARTALLTILAVLLLAAPAQSTFIQEYAPGFGNGPQNQSELLGITLGPDGNIWVVNNDNDALGRVTPAGQLTEFPLDPASDLRDIVLGPDGNFWITAPGHGGFVIVSPTGQIVQRCYLLGDPGNPAASWNPVAAARVGGRVFFTSSSGTPLASFDAGCGNVLWGFSPPGPGNQYLEAIDGKLWMPGGNDGNVYRINPFPQPTNEAAIAAEFLPGDITLGPDGNVWFTIPNQNKIGRVARDAPNGAAATLFSSSELFRPEGIAPGPDGNVWVASPGNSRIARVTPGGTITTYTDGITPFSEPRRITAGPDSDLWFSEFLAKKVGRILPDQPPRASTDSYEVPNPTTATVRGTVNSRGAGTSVFFDYGTTAGYGSSAAAGEVAAGVGNEQRTAVLSGLRPDTVYHFRIRVVSPHGTATGADLSFRTRRGVSGVDADDDGISAPADCDDSNRAIRPGARDIPGNGVDENCDGIDGSYPLLGATFTSAYRVFAHHTRFRKLSANSLDAGVTVRLICKGKRKGCPKKNRTIKVEKSRKKVGLMKFVRGRRFRPGARVDIRVIAADAIGRVRRIRFRRGKLPRVRAMCQNPNSKRPHPC